MQQVYEKGSSYLLTCWEGVRYTVQFNNKIVFFHCTTRIIYSLLLQYLYRVILLIYDAQNMGVHVVIYPRNRIIFCFLYANKFCAFYMKQKHDTNTNAFPLTTRLCNPIAVRGNSFPTATCSCERWCAFFSLTHAVHSKLPSMPAALGSWIAVPRSTKNKQRQANIPPQLGEKTTNKWRGKM